MTIAASEIADALRWVWLGAGVAWIAYAWLNRIAYRRTLAVLIAIVVLDWGLHAVASYAEQPDSGIPSDLAVYSVYMVTAALVGLGVAALYARWRRIDVNTVMQAALVCVIVGGIGGRAYQVWMHWDYYAENRAMLAALAQGGFGMRGALIFGLLALVVFALVTRRSFWQLADAGGLGLAAAQSIGWYGASITHTHYGLALDTAPAPQGVFAPLALALRGFGYNFAQDLPDAYNIIALRVPVQLLTSIFFLALFVILLVTAFESPRRVGFVFLRYLLIASAASFLFGFWRGDETLSWNGLRVDQWIDAGLFVVALALSFTRQRTPLRRAPRASASEREALQHA